MTSVSLDTLKKRLRQTTWLPLGIMAALLLGATSFILYQERQEQLKNTEHALADVVQSQETLISQEVYMGQDQALKIRIDSILSNWNQKYPGGIACLEFLVSPPTGEPRLISGCSSDAIDSRSLRYEETSVKAGNKVLAKIRYSVSRPTRIWDIFPPMLIIVVLVGLFAAVFTHFTLVSRVETRVLAPLIEKISESERNAAIAQTAQMMAHDIRKPFRLVQLALARLHEVKNKEVRELSAKVSEDFETSARSIDVMIRDILDMGREVHLSLEPVPVARLVEQLHGTLARLYPENRVKFSFDIRQRHRVMADTEQLMRVLINIGENAVQAVRLDGSIRISSKQTIRDGNSFIDIAISNDGPEITDEDRSKLFTPFFSRKAAGTGLGLAVAKKIVAEHKGEIVLNSKATETCFTVSIPEAAKGAVAPIRHAITADETNLKATHEQTILIFDDEAVVRSHWRKHAKEHDFQAAWDFSSWEDFVSQNGFALTPGAIAFIDIHYKGSKYDGIEIARSLRDLGVKKIFAITNDPEMAVASGLFDSVFGKDIPANFDQLVG
jgi:signal transduction histidine kinase